MQEGVEENPTLGTAPDTPSYGTDPLRSAPGSITRFIADEG